MITVGYCCREHNEECMSYLKDYFHGRAEVIEKLCSPERNYYISEAMNDVIKEASNDIILIMHDNVRFIESERYPAPIDEALEKIFDDNPEYGILGVAPSAKWDRDVVDRDYASNCSLYGECDEDGSNLYIHTAEEGTCRPFSYEIFDEVAVDGCCIAFRRDRLKAGFCDENKSFHFYDIEFCLGNYIRGVKVGIIKAFLIQHYRSQSERTCWGKWEEVKNTYFVPKWKEYLPVIHHKNKPHMVILTGVIHPEKLPLLADSIYENIVKRGDIDLVWYVCFDAKCNTDTTEIEKICDRYRINVFINKGVGSANEPNYGGTLFNEWLRWLTYSYYNQYIDPWVYVLDNDNVISPLMGSQLIDMFNAADNANKRCVWMSMHREDGFIDTIRSYSIYGKGMNNHYSIADEFMPDPSQLMIKLSLLDEMGYYGEGYTYDQSLWDFFYHHQEELCLPEEWHIGHWGGRGNNNFYQCYHDGINDEAAEELVKTDIENNSPLSFSLIAGRSESCERFLLNKEQGRRAFENLTNHSKYKYSVLTCIFNGYESLKEIKDYREDVEYVCVTDDPNMTSKQWKIVYAPDILLDAPPTNKYTYVRFHPFEFVESNVCIIIDGSMELLKDMYDSLVIPFIDGNYEYGVTMHHERSNMYDEIDAWRLIRGYDEAETERIKNIFRAKGYNKEGMVQSGFMIQRYGRVSDRINNLSWEMCHNLMSGSEIYRNFQIALAYVLNEYYYDDKRIMLIHPSTIESPYVRHWTHSGQYWVVYNAEETCPCLFWNKHIEPFRLK